MTRRLAREAVMQTLFARDLGNDEPEVLVVQLGKEAHLSPQAKVFGSKLVEGVILNQIFLDEIINDYALAWDLERIAFVDRNILRIALYELILGKKIPVAVVINESLEIAKIYSAKDAPRFINGILGKVIQDLPELKKSRAQELKES